MADEFNNKGDGSVFNTETTPVETPTGESPIFGDDFQTNPQIEEQNSIKGDIFNNMEKISIQKEMPTFEDTDSISGESNLTDKGKTKNDKIKNIVIISVAVIFLLYYGYTYLQKNTNKNVENTGTGVVQSSTGTKTTANSGGLATSTGATKVSYDIKKSKFGVLYGSGFSDTGSINFAGNVLIQAHDENGDIGVGFVSSFKYQDLKDETKISGMFKNFKFMSTHPDFFDGNMTRILAMGKLYYSEKLKSGYFQFDNIITPESVLSKYKKTIETYTNHWGQYPTGSITPKKTMNLFNVFNQVIKSDSDFNSLFIPYENSSGSGNISLSGGTLSGAINKISVDTTSMSGEILELNTNSPLVEKISTLLDDNLSKILFNAETKTLISINGDSLNMIIKFPSVLFFEKNSTGDITLTINGNLTQGESLVGDAPTDTRVWGSEYIDNITNNSTFTPLNSTGTLNETGTGK